MINNLKKFSYKKIILALMTIFLFFIFIELTIYYIFKPTFWDRTSWLIHDPYKGESFDRLILREKLGSLDSINPDIITIGDSSGFFSLHPELINKYLNGIKIANISTGANQAFEGYLTDAKWMLKKNKGIKYVILYMHPNLIPTPKVIEKADLAPIVHEQLNSYRGILSSPPSAMFSRYMKTKIFTGYETSKEDTLSSHLVYLQFNKTVSITKGWVPEHDIRYSKFNGKPMFFPDRETELKRKYSIEQIKIFLKLRDESSINHYLNQFAELCREYGVVPIIAFNPMPWTNVLLTSDAQEGILALERFSLENPDVHFATPYITIWGSEKFGMFNHISREYVHLSSARFGLSISKVINELNSIHPFIVGDYKNKYIKSPDINYKLKATTEQKKAALSYYLYTATGQKFYLENFSTRVKSVIKNEPSFNDYLHAIEFRNKYMKSDKVEMLLGYDISQIDADVVEVKGINHCNFDNSLTYIRLSGKMIFTLKSKLSLVQESVDWPIGSDIIIPIIYENNEHKFDGYCTEEFGDYIYKN